MDGATIFGLLMIGGVVVAIYLDGQSTKRHSEWAARKQAEESAREDAREEKEEREAQVQ
jgi:hypothetical protein